MTEQMKTDTNPQQRKRHGCLTAYLIILLWQSCAYLWLFYSISLDNTPLWDVLFFASFAVNIFGIIALFKWKKWGFWMLCITGFISMLALLFGGYALGVLWPMIVVAILYGVLQIGGESKGWNQLEG